MFEITYGNGAKVFWTQNETFNILDDLAGVDKRLQWLHSDLSVSNSTFLQKILWKILSISPNFRNWVFDTDLDAAKSILIQLKPQIHQGDLQNIFNKAVLKFSEIGHQHTDGLKLFDYLNLPQELSDILISNNISEEVITTPGLFKKITDYLEHKDLANFKLTSKKINLAFNNGVTQVIFKKLPSKEMISLLKKYHQLISLDFSKLEHLVDDNYLAQIINELIKIPTLKGLNLSKSSIRRLDSFFSITNLKSLKELEFQECYGVEDDALCALSGLTELKFLNVNGCYSLTNKGLEYISQFKDLISLDLGNCCRISDRGIAKLAKLDQLQSLSLLGCSKVTDNGLKPLGQLRKLRDLNLGFCSKITDVAFTSLKNIQTLQTLSLDGCFRITNNSLSLISELSNLQILSLNECINLDKEGIAHLESINKLKALYLSGCYDIDDSALEFISRIPSLEILDLWGAEISDSGFLALDRLSNLKMLYLCENYPIDIEFDDPYSLTGKLNTPAFKNLSKVKIEMYDKGFNPQIFSTFRED